jgi:hypothetical protein
MEIFVVIPARLLRPDLKDEENFPTHPVGDQILGTAYSGHNLHAGHSCQVTHFKREKKSFALNKPLNSHKLFPAMFCSAVAMGWAIRKWCKFYRVLI